MLFSGRSKPLPHLLEYLDHAIRERPANPLELPWALAALGVAAGGVTWAVASLVGGQPATWQVFAAAGGLWWIGAGVFWFRKRSTEPLSQEATTRQRLRMEAYQIVRRLHASKEKRRLHRDLSDSVSSLLEECARSWSRAHQALESAFWRNANLPLHWQSLRDHASTAVDQTMDEVLVILSNAVPEEPGKWRIDEVVEEVLGKRVFSGHEIDDRMPMTFDPARELAQKLMMLAAEIERATRDVAKDEAIASQFSSGSALDLCLGELRQIQQAESELRQNLET